MLYSLLFRCGRKKLASIFRVDINKWRRGRRCASLASCHAVCRYRCWITSVRTIRGSRNGGAERDTSKFIPQGRTPIRHGTGKKGTQAVRFRLSLNSTLWPLYLNSSSNAKNDSEVPVGSTLAKSAATSLRSSSPCLFNTCRSTILSDMFENLIHNILE